MMPENDTEQTNALPTNNDVYVAARMVILRLLNEAQTAPLDQLAPIAAAISLYSGWAIGR